MTVYSNNHTIVTEEEFLENPKLLVESTINRQGADLIIVDKKTLKPVLWVHRDELLGVLK